MYFSLHSHRQHGAALSLFIIFFTVSVTALLVALNNNLVSDVSALNRLAETKQAYMSVEALTEDVLYRRSYGTFSVDSVESLSFAGAMVYATTTYDSPSDIYTIAGQSYLRKAVRKSTVELGVTAGTNISYGLFSGTGGIALANSARVIGDTYANGPIVGSGSSEILGDAVSAGPAGLIEGLTATGSVFANTIDDVTVDGDAHYNIALGSNSIGGTVFTPAVNQATSAYPISDELVQEWKDAVDDYGTVIAAGSPLCSSGTYEIDVSISIGYVRIECDVNISKSGTTVTMTGPIWIEGNLSFTQGPTVRVNPALGRFSTQFIVDNSADRLTSSRIEIRNQTDFLGSGDSRSYILLYSANESYSTGGTDDAIAVFQSADGQVIIYADSGLVDVSNGVELRGVTGYQIDVAQNSDIIYEEGMSNLLFTAGPGSGYVLTDWEQSE